MTRHKPAVVRTPARADKTTRGLRVTAALALAVLACVVVPAATRAAAPSQFAGFDGTCNHTVVDTTTFTGDPVTSGHSPVLVEYTVGGSQAEITLDGNPLVSGDTFTTAYPGETPAGSLASGDAPTVVANCSASEVADAPFTATFLDLPTLPVTFSGAAGPSGTVNPNKLLFNVAVAGDYVVDVSDSVPVTLQSLDAQGNPVGALTTVSPPPVGPSRYHLGTLQPGTNELTLKVGVSSHAGPWTATIHPAPTPVAGHRAPTSVSVRAIRSNDCRSGTTSTRLQSDSYSGMSEPARTQE